MSNFFIRRPIVAIVISILMVIVGAITITSLPVAQFPDIAPPEVRVFAMYPGADAETMEQAVATPIEQQVSGVDNMDYMYSLNSTGNSSTALMVDFDLKTNPNDDLLLTQSRQQLANGQLPPVVQWIGIDVKKSLTSPMMLVALYSPKGTLDTNFLANYAYINLNDPLGRSYGIGLTQVYAGQYAMRIWLKPDRLAKLGVTVSEVFLAVQSQNTVNPAGQVGGEPAFKGQPFTYAVRAQSRLKTPEEFGDIIVRENPEGGVVRVRDVATVELGSQDYNVVTRLDGKPTAVMGIYQLPGSNAVEAAKGVRKLMAKMKESFPADLDYEITLDTTDAVRAGMHEPSCWCSSSCISSCKTGVPRSFQCWRCLFRWWARSLSSRSLVFPSTHFHCSAWCWPSDWWWTMPLLWSRVFSGTSKRGWLPRMRLERLWKS